MAVGRMRSVCARPARAAAGEGQSRRARAEAAPQLVVAPVLALALEPAEALRRPAQRERAQACAAPARLQRLSEPSRLVAYPSWPELLLSLPAWLSSYRRSQQR